jgi:putative ABC transport system permease protein
MIRNYLKIAWRNLMKNKVFSFINIFGLSVGLTCCILISLYIYHEVSYDRYHENGNRIFRLGTTFIDQGVEERGSTTSAPLGKMLQEEYPEIAASTRSLQLFRDDKTLFRVQHPYNYSVMTKPCSGYNRERDRFILFMKRMAF